MDGIYANASLTVATASTNDSSEGFLNPKTKGLMEPIPFEDEEGVFHLSFLTEDGWGTQFSDSLKDQPLSKRPWTLQERLLASRILHFATDQMHWRYSEQATNERFLDEGTQCRQYSLQDVIECLQSTNRGYHGLQPWFRFVRECTSRNMTFDSDKLPALSGIIAATERETNYICYAGDWENHFLEGFAWCVVSPEATYAQVEDECADRKEPRRVGFWRAPSWSFAAIEGTVTYATYPVRLDTFCAGLEECSLTTSGPNRHGELMAGFIWIKGPLVTIVSVEAERRGRESNAVFGYGKRLLSGHVHFDLERHETCLALMLSFYTGLALVPVGVAGNTYTRVGLIIVDEFLLIDSEVPHPIRIMIL